jgi:beta-lactamase superfamily II metal-dependent hydrolase
MPVRPESLCVHVLNVGDGDNLILQFPEIGGLRRFAIVDCYSSRKTIDYLNKLGANQLEFVCATHPHYDHIRGIPKLLQTYKNRIGEFWESGFRHTSLTYEKIMDLIGQDPGIRFFRVTSGMERICNGVRVSILAPSINLRNRYDTYGVNINNASVVLKLEYKAPDAVNPSTIILGGDAQFESWAKVIEEYPRYEKTTNPDQKIQVEKSFNPLNCQVLKVSHHGSKHGTALEYVETLDPEYAIVSCSSSSSYGFPHEIALLSLMEETEKIYFTDYQTPEKSRSGTTVLISHGTTRPEIVSLREERSQLASPP